MSSAFELLHHTVQQKLWDMRWTELRPIQSETIKHLLMKGGDCVISSPTASGKTEAAFLPVLSSIADTPQGSVRAMYIGPLKALINDQFRRIEDLCARMEMPVHKWHGDVNASARRALLDAPSGVLLITPESLEAMFVLRPTLVPSLFSNLEFVVIDELHAFLESERGAQLRSQLHRLRLRAGCNPTRIGLSATIGDPERALRWLRPEGPLATHIAGDGSQSSLRLRVRGIWKEPPSEIDSDDADANDASLTELARSILLACRGKTNLVFANAKSRIEALADELTTQAAEMNLPDEIVVHHGSLSKERRESAEARLRQTTPCTAVCSNTLEMGIDIGEISEVVQVSAPWSVASLKQRLGRSGRRVDKGRVLRAYFVEERPTEKSDVWARLHLGFIQGLATVELMLGGFLEPPETDRAHLSTLVHQVLSIIAETGGVTAVALYQRAVSGGAFGEVSRSDFTASLRELGRLDLIEQMPDGTLVLGMKGQKIVEHYSFYAAFNGSSELRVVCGNDEIGTVALPPPPGEHLILAGRRWRVEDIDAGRREVLVSPARGRRAPWYQSRGGTIHRVIHEKMRDLLVEASVPSYLDGVAVEILTAARETASQCARFQPRSQPYEQGVRLFVWGGSRVQQTLAIAFAAAGARYSDEGVGFDVEATPIDLGRFLQEFARDPRPMALSAFADEQMRLREVGLEKFDPFVPSELWRRAFVREQLDIEGTVGVAIKLGVGLLPAGSAHYDNLVGAPAIDCVEVGLVASQIPQDVEVPGRGAVAMTPLAGLLFRGATLTEFDDGVANTGRLGCPVWNRAALLADLELRLGISGETVEPGVRLQKWSRRLADISSETPRFYSSAYAVDPIGTATTLLAWRDVLVDSGWNGEPVAGGSERLDTLVELERGLSLPLGTADRIRRAETELARTKGHLWDKLFLAEPPPAWPERWRRVFALLSERGVRVEHLVPGSAQAVADSDLGRLQASIRGAEVGRGFRGDGSLILLTGETSWEAAHAVAALLAANDRPSTVVLRGGDVAALNAAFKVQGLAGQGFASESRWRSALQLLPLALELAYAPRDPYRMLELVTLPLGPFAGWVGLQLARAISESPGIGGRAWERAKQAVVAAIPGSSMQQVEEDSAAAQVQGRADRLTLIAEWLESPGHQQDPGAPRSSLLEVAERVGNYLGSRLAGAAREAARGETRGGHEETILGAAFAQASAFRAALDHDKRDHLDLVAVRQLLEEVSLGRVSLDLGVEDAGRIDLVDAPAGLRCRRDQVIWWYCVSDTRSTASIDPWRVGEREALAELGVRLPERSALLAAEVEAWRRVVLSAERRLVLVVPGTAYGARLDPHPIWDELVARLRAEAGDVAAVTLTSDDLLEGTRELARGFPVAAQELPALKLPVARAAWQLAPSLLSNTTSYSASSLEELLGCPLAWVFKRRAGLRSSWALAIASGPLLNGRLGHRLIEELHKANSFRSLTATAVSELLERLIDQEAAVLRRPGMTFELSQLRLQMAEGIEQLASILAANGLSIAEVELKTSADLAGRSIEGRIDLLLEGAGGKEVVLDIKWGRASYEARLRDGLALQLATYSATRQIERGHAAPPAAAYFALSRGTMLTTDPSLFATVRPIPGPGIQETWSKLERTLVAIEKLLAQGTIPVTGVSGSKSLLESAGIPDIEREQHLDPGPACDHCRYASLCGRAWETLS